MSSRSENGIANLAGDFRILIGLIRNLDSNYAPGQQCLSIAGLEKLAAEVERAIETCHFTHASLQKQMQERNTAFKRLGYYVTSLSYEFSSYPFPAEIKKVLRRYVAKIRGYKKGQGKDRK